MEQTIYALLTGILGIMVHTLMKINNINRRTKGKINLKEFFAVEWPSIWISVSIVIVALIAREEIQKLKVVGNYLLFGFFCIGLSAQSIAYYVSNRLERRLAKKEQEADLKIDEIKDVINEIGAGQIGLPQVPSNEHK